MQHWSWWLSGLALSGVPVFNWLLVRRLMAVSGRYTALVDRVRLGPPSDDAPMTPEELMAAVRAATVEEFGADAVDDAPQPGDLEPVAPPAPPRSAAMHVVFLASLVLGGLLSAALAGSLEFRGTLAGTSFAAVFGSATWVTPVVLLSGGALVGFGTRMASGCTSGHGLCGVSRAQPGSLLATVAFFGAGVAASFVLGALT